MPIPPDPEALRARLRGWLGAQVRAALDARADALAAPEAERAQIEAATLDLGQRIGRLTREARALTEAAAALQGSFHGDMSIEAARNRHPAAPSVFARHHLPACDGCAVRFDETVAEAAAAYGLDLDALLGDLNGLL